MRTLKAMITTVMVAMFSLSAHAAFPEGQWNNHFRSIVNGVEYFHQFCLKADGTWYATSYPGSGRWTLSGSNVLINGMHSDIGMAEAHALKKQGPLAMKGFLQQWMPDDTYTDFYVAEWNRVSLSEKKCAPAFPSPAN
ncbi:hypothetical protein KAK07_22590 [Ideonella sp. 4Y16]|uniref:Uncharacterized protein n=1 Tax=Ideonella aquatica TaxID=2824119 RepID=A0A940YR22_9BURK|nr:MULTISPECIES: hypothetical protein [Ideonella]MBQ0946148.1 hypothetical protein [Ideonella alba]MBQ0960428.1 hypothetical protein [Ideonella aquatica]